MLRIFCGVYAFAWFRYFCHHYMKRFFTCIIFLLIAGVAKSQYQVTLQAPQYKEGLTYLTYYYGKNRNIQDSAFVNDKGVAVFKKNEKLLPASIR